MANSPGRYDPDVLSFMVGYIAAELYNAERCKEKAGGLRARPEKEIEENAYRRACESPAIRRTRSAQKEEHLVSERMQLTRITRPAASQREKV